jgi:hypothetical protein
MIVSGQCLCGDVRYHGEAEPRFQVRCYCIDCRKVSAGGHAAMMGFAANAVRITGETREYQSRADSGSVVARGFCTRCGSGIYSRNEAMSELIFIRASTLDDPNLFTPQLTVYASRALAWDPVPEGVPAFAEGPPRG